MPATYEPIATSTLGTAAQTIAFASIPATYTDLKLVVVGKMSSSTGNLAFWFNSVSDPVTQDFSQTILTGNGTSATSTRYTTQYYGYVNSGSLTTNIAMGTIDVFSYAGSTKKTSLTTFANDQNGSGEVTRNVVLWNSTSAITRFTVSTTGANFAVGTTATLYGIKAA